MRDRMFNDFKKIIKSKRKYQVIYADPPWHYDHVLQKGDHAFPGYDLLTNDELKKFPLYDIAADRAVLFLWVTFPKLSEALEVIKKWKFNYKTLGFSWIKTNTGNGQPFFGIGNYTRSNCEVCLIATKGRTLPRKNKKISSVIMSPRQTHSKKPQQVRNKIVKMYGDVPRIELFARTRAAGWDVFGNDTKLSTVPLEKYYGL